MVTIKCRLGRGAIAGPIIEYLAVSEYLAMKQILQNLKDGSTEIAEVPCPQVGRGDLLIRTTLTLISAGTERMLVDFGKANPLEKARQQPDKVRQVLEKVKTDGLAPTLAAVRGSAGRPWRQSR